MPFVTVKRVIAVLSEETSAAIATTLIASVAAFLNFALELTTMIATTTVAAVRSTLEAASSIPIATVAATAIMEVLLLGENWLFGFLGVNLELILALTLLLARLFNYGRLNFFIMAGRFLFNLNCVLGFVLNNLRFLNLLNRLLLLFINRLLYHLSRCLHELRNQACLRLYKWH